MLFVGFSQVQVRIERDGHGTVMLATEEPGRQ